MKKKLFVGVGQNLWVHCQKSTIWIYVHNIYKLFNVCIYTYHYIIHRSEFLIAVSLMNLCCKLSYQFEFYGFQKEWLLLGEIIYRISKNKRQNLQQKKKIVIKL